MNPIGTPELLAPAGNLETAVAAYDAGADAVYCGLGKFNARERAENFTTDSLARLLDHAHGLGRKLYLTLNTLVKESELPEVAEYLAELGKLRPDALIVQDPGVAALVREYFPSLTLHASTQMGIHNSAGVAAAARLGFRRVILERQVTLDELREIAKRSELELEVFLHGSLCCSLSGRCLLSSALGGWSGNRGKCKQPCRREYTADGHRGFLLSPHDLYGVPLLPELRRIGVASLKIEGRLRSPDYVWKTVKAYRMLLDGPVDPPPELLAEAEQLLRSTATRRPSNGFFFAKEFPALIDSGRLGSFGIAAGRVLKRDRSGITVKTDGRLHLGDRVRLVPPDGGEGDGLVLTKLRIDDREAVLARPGSVCFIPGDFAATPGWTLYKIGENGFDFSRRAATLPSGRHPVTIQLQLGRTKWSAAIAELPGERWECAVDFAPAEKRPFSAETACGEFASAVPEPWSTPGIQAKVEGEYFVPASTLKTLRREFWNWAAERLKVENLNPEATEGMYRFYQDYRNLPGEVAPFAPSGPALELPGFAPEAELPALRRKIRAAYDSGTRTFRIGALHELELLREYPDIAIVAGYPLPVCNSLAALALKPMNVCAVEPFPELDSGAATAFAAKSPLPLAEAPNRPPLLVTRLPLPEGTWVDARGHKFRVVHSNNLSELYPDFPVDFLKNDWK